LPKNSKGIGYLAGRRPVFPANSKEEGMRVEDTISVVSKLLSF
jgi:hypothetical protein